MDIKTKECLSINSQHRLWSHSLNIQCINPNVLSLSQVLKTMFPPSCRTWLPRSHFYPMLPPRFQGSHATTNASGANHLPLVNKNPTTGGGFWWVPSLPLWMWRCSTLVQKDSAEQWARCTDETGKSTTQTNLFFTSNIITQYKSWIIMANMWDFSCCTSVSRVFRFCKKSVKRSGHFSSWRWRIQLRIPTSICSMTSSKAFRVSMFMMNRFSIYGICRWTWRSFLLLKSGPLCPQRFFFRNIEALYIDWGGSFTDFFSIRKYLPTSGLVMTHGSSPTQGRLLVSGFPV